MLGDVPLRFQTVDEFVDMLPEGAAGFPRDPFCLGVVKSGFGPGYLRLGIAGQFLGRSAIGATLHLSLLATSVGVSVIPNLAVLPKRCHHFPPCFVLGLTTMCS